MEKCGSSNRRLSNNMDRSLVNRCIRYHGKELFLKLSSEIDNLNIPDMSASSRKHHCAIKNDQLRERLLKLIARHSSTLFSSKSVPPENSNQSTDVSAVGPLELYMKVPADVRLERLLRELKVGDIVLCQVTSIMDSGLVMCLLALEGKAGRYIKDLKVTAACGVRDLPPKRKSQHSPLDDFEVRDKVRAVVSSVSRVHETISVSLRQSSLPSASQNVQLGHVDEDEVPWYCRRTDDDADNYEERMMRHKSFSNPSFVTTATAAFGLNDKCPPSLIPDLDCLTFPAEEYADSLRQTQSRHLAMKSVHEGVEHLKHGRQVESMQCLKKALQIDEHNVEALVARGALYANTGSYMNAIEDFDEALHYAPNHGNAKRYLYETLVAQANNLLEIDGDAEARKLADRALRLRPGGKEASAIIDALWQRAEKQRKVSSVVAVSSDSEPEDSAAITEAAGKLRHLMASEHKKKHHRSRTKSRTEPEKLKKRKSRSRSLSNSSSEREAKKRRSAVVSVSSDSDSDSVKILHQQSSSSSKRRSRHTSFSFSDKHEQHRKKSRESRSTSRSKEEKANSAKKHKHKNRERSKKRKKHRRRDSSSSASPDADGREKKPRKSLDDSSGYDGQFNTNGLQHSEQRKSKADISIVASGGEANSKESSSSKTVTTASNNAAVNKATVEVKQNAIEDAAKRKSLHDMEAFLESLKKKKSNDKAGSRGSKV